METFPNLFIKVLQILASNYGMSCTLDELTTLLTPLFNSSTVFSNNMSAEKENQAKVLDVLIHLNGQGLIFLNSTTDKSSISIKGLIKVNNKIICN
jgi:hypothetical protein